MITFTAGAEYNLRQLLESLDKDKDNWHLYHFLTSHIRKGISRKEAAKVAFNIIQNFIKEQEGAVFFCEDGDIFILYQTSAATLMEEMAYQLHYLFADSITGDTPAPFATSLDLQNNYAKAVSLAQSKVQATINAPKEVTATAEVAPVDTLSPSEQDRRLFASAASKRFQRKEKHILLVEDDPLSLRLVKNILHTEYKILTAETGKEAFESYVSQAPDVVFLDIGLPDTSGLQVLEKILKLDNTANVVMLSGHTYQEAIMQAMKTGAKGFVGKPFTRERLMRYIQNVGR